MKPHNSSRSRKAITLIEILLVLAIVALVLSLLVPSVSRPKTRMTPNIRCYSNLKYTALSFRLFAVDNKDLYPMQLSTNVGGSMEYVGTGKTFEHFRSPSNELNVPKVLLCPRDDSRIEAADFRASFQSNSNISYFLNLDARDTGGAPSQQMLSGDRWLTLDDSPITGVHSVTTNSNLGWHKPRHEKKGFVAFVDGSVQALTSEELRATLARSTIATNLLSVPD